MGLIHLGKAVEPFIRYGDYATFGSIVQKA